MALPAILGIINMIRGMSNKKQEPISQPQGYGNNPTNVPPGTIRGVNSNTNMYQNVGQVGQNVQPNQYRVWDSATNSYQDGPQAQGSLMDRQQQQPSGGGNAMGTIGSAIGGLSGSNEKERNQYYQMPYTRR